MTPRSPLQIAAALTGLPQLPFLVGRERELVALRAHVRARRPVFMSGPAGMGKTTLLRHVSRACESDALSMPLLYCGESNSRRTIIIHVLVNLFLQRGRLESCYVDRRKTVASPAELRRFLALQRLPDLARMMHQNLDRNGACLVLDHLDAPHPKVASLIEIWLEHAPLVVVARAAERVGRVRWLLSAFEPLELPPLAAASLLRLARDRLAPRRVDALREADIREAVRRCGGNPGRLGALLDAAALPQYRKNGAIQWRLVDLDLRIRALSGDDARASSQRR